MNLRACPQLSLLVLATASLLASAATVNEANGLGAAAVPVGATKSAGLVIESEVQPGAGSGGSTRVRLRVTGATDPAGAQLRYSVKGAAQLVRADAAVVPAGVPAIREVDVRLTSPAGGEQAYLNVFMAHGGRAGVMSVPLKTHELVRKSSGSSSFKLERDASGEPLVILPARTGP